MDPPMFGTKASVSSRMYCAIIPLHTLSVTQLLIFNLPANLETNLSTTNIVFSQESPMVQLPADFVSQSVPTFSTATALRDHASSAWQDGNQSVIHPSFPDDPLPLWVLSYWVSMSRALEHQRDWRISHDWILDRLDTVSCDCPELEIIDDIFDVIEHLPWDAPLKGVGACTDLSTSGLRPLLASGPIGGRLVDTMIAAVVEHMQSSENRDLQTVNGVNRIISYADTLGWNSPTHDINAIRHWLSCHNLSGFNEANTLQHGEHQDSFSCGIAAINTIKHAVFHDPLFDNDRAFSLRMDEFLDLAHDHLELSVPGDDMDICNGSDIDNGSDFDSDAEMPESGDDLKVEETQKTIPAKPLSTQNKPKLNLRTTDADQNKGLFKFFPQISREEHLQHAWKPFAWELRDKEQDLYQQEFEKFEKAARMRERAAERKRKQRAREKVAKQKLKPSIDSVLHDSNPPPPAISIAEASRPYRQLQRHARTKQTSNLGH
ncbi:hypothetical protein F4604DRAFT_2020782 [Suillus subluteus]|nr:hypothetical protein F4604DRAFT_2020782 [Suillus subluteus]